MKKRAIPKLIEKQKSLLCGKHAINNLLQQKIADCNKLKTVSKYMSNIFNIPINELLDTKTGSYDVSDLVRFLQDTGLEVTELIGPYQVGKGATWRSWPRRWRVWDAPAPSTRRARTRRSGPSCRS